MAITIDSDAHVIESDRTWEFMTGADTKHKPTTVAPVAEQSDRLYWIIDGKLKARRTNIGGDTTEATREVMDVEARLRHMDDLGTDIQVLYPTTFGPPQGGRRVEVREGPRCVRHLRARFRR